MYQQIILRLNKLEKMKNIFKNWKLKEFLLLLLEIVFFIVGGCIVFPIVFIIGVIYSFIKHLFFKFDYSVSKQFTPIIRSITLASDGLANAGCGELLNDVLKVKKEAKIKYGKPLFKTATKKLINADLNGSLNILRKVIGEFQYPIKVCSTPLVLTIK